MGRGRRGGVPDEKMRRLGGRGVVTVTQVNGLQEAAFYTSNGQRW